MLEPLRSDWDALDPIRKEKWRGIAQRYPTMRPTDQQRMQKQMRAWAELTPEQRRAARERYKSLHALPPDKKQDVRQKWEQYQTLPPEAKRELARRQPAAAAHAGCRWRTRSGGAHGPRRRDRPRRPRRGAARQSARCSCTTDCPPLPRWAPLPGGAPPVAPLPGRRPCRGAPLPRSAPLARLSRQHRRRLPQRRCPLRPAPARRPHPFRQDRPLPRQRRRDPRGSDLTGEPAPAGLPLPRAGLVRRLGAVVYEALLLAAVLFITGFVLLPLTSGRAADAIVVPTAAVRFVTFVVLFAVVGLYCVTLWSHGRRTLPMKTWHLRLVCRDGSAPDRGTALRRYLACWIGPALALGAYFLLHARGTGTHAAWFLAFNFAWALVDRDRQFLHDRLAGTVVLDERQRSPSAG